MARVETAGPERIQGYSVILGDDNACYEKPSVADSLWGNRRTGCVVHAVDACLPTGNWRKNLPDQKNVAWAAFVSSEKENNCRRNYTIAVLVVNRVSKLKLWNTTGKYLTVELPAAKE